MNLGQVLGRFFDSPIGLNLTVLFILVSFASNSIITRFVVNNNIASAFALTVIRFASGFLFLGIVHAVFPQTFPRMQIKRQNILGGVFLVFYGFSISFGFLFIGAASGTFIFYAAVMISMAIYSILAEREKVGSRKVIGMVIALAGILTLTFQGNQTLTALGVILMLITGISWGVYSVWGRRLADPFGYTFYSFLIVTLIAVPPQTIFGAREILEIPFSLAGWGLILYFGMISTAFSYILWHKALRRLRASQGGIYQMLVPVIAAAMGIILLSEQLAISLVVGGGLIVLGVYLNR